MVPESRELLDKPDVATHCPATGKRLRLKDLIPVKFTRLQYDGGDKPVRCAPPQHRSRHIDQNHAGVHRAAAVTQRLSIIGSCANAGPHTNKLRHRNLLAQWETPGTDVCTAKRG